MPEQLSWSCPDCGISIALTKTDHRCMEAGQRLAAVMVEAVILDFYYVASVPDLQISFNGVGLLWLYRIAYRICSRMNGLEKYKDRAEMARLGCELGGELYK